MAVRLARKESIGLQLISNADDGSTDCSRTTIQQDNHHEELLYSIDSWHVCRHLIIERPAPHPSFSQPKIADARHANENKPMTTRELGELFHFAPILG